MERKKNSPVREPIQVDTAYDVDKGDSKWDLCWRLARAFDSKWEQGMRPFCWTMMIRRIGVKKISRRE
jgi:hypothetical protein